MYKSCPNDYILIKYYSKNNKYINCVQSNKRTLIIPGIHDYFFVPSGINTVGIKLEDIQTRDNYRVNISLVISYEICINETYIQNAIDNNNFYRTTNISLNIKNYISDKITHIIKNTFVNEFSNSELLLGKINNELQNKLKTYGISIIESVLANTKIG